MTESQRLSVIDESPSVATPPADRDLPPLIAVVGCDGSGKSTVTGELLEWLGAQRPTVVCHLGKQSGNVGRAIAQWPMLGRRLDKSIQVRSKKAQGTKGPGLLAALVIYGFLMRRVRRFRRMMRLREGGHAIIADRFPQVEVTGASDGPGLYAARPTGLVGVLARSERRIFAKMIASPPDLVLRLNVSLDVAAARKPDHKYEALARKIELIPHLTFGGAPIVELNADEPLEQVLLRAKAAVADLMAARRLRTAA